ncbi:hypothetical protein JCM8202_004514, partial [Rhodotorula sphaerocarpa]
MLRAAAKKPVLPTWPTGTTALPVPTGTLTLAPLGKECYPGKLGEDCDLDAPKRQVVWGDKTASHSLISASKIHPAIPGPALKGLKAKTYAEYLATLEGAGATLFHADETDSSLTSLKDHTDAEQNGSASTTASLQLSPSRICGSKDALATADLGPAGDAALTLAAPPPAGSAISSSSGPALRSATGAATLEDPEQNSSSGKRKLTTVSDSDEAAPRPQDNNVDNIDTAQQDYRAATVSITEPVQAPTSRTRGSEDVLATAN